MEQKFQAKSDKIGGKVRRRSDKQENRFMEKSLFHHKNISFNKIQHTF